MIVTMPMISDSTPLPIGHPCLPSGKLIWKITMLLLMGKSTIYMAIFNSYVSLPEGSQNTPYTCQLFSTCHDWPKQKLDFCGGATKMSGCVRIWSHFLGLLMGPQIIISYITNIIYIHYKYL